MREDAWLMRQRAKGRPLGHDLVVAALLLVSCSETSEKEVGRDVAAHVDAPVKARVDRTKVEITETAGCRCTGRSTPSCELRHCTSSTEAVFKCELAVERDVTARGPTACAKDGTVKLEVDPTGERMATADEHVWRLYAGGWEGALAIDDREGMPRATEKLDWSALPSAREIVRSSLGRELERARYDDVQERVVMAARFSNLAHVAREHLGEDLATLAPHDRALDPCARRGSSWGDSYEKQPSAVRAEVKAKLASTLQGPFDESAGRSAKPAARVLQAREVIEHVGAPEPFLESRLAQPGSASSIAAAMVLQAWSQMDPKPAAAFACQALSRIPKDHFEDAAFAAIAHARLSCPAAKARTPRWCDETHAIRELEDEQTDVKADTVFCEPWEGFLLTQRLTDRKFDAEAFHVLCRRANAAARDASTDAEPEEDDD